MNRNGEKFNVGETFAGLGFEKGLELVEKLRPLVPAGYTLPQLALRWCLDHPAVTTIIPGARNRAQALANVAASDLVPEVNNAEGINSSLLMFAGVALFWITEKLLHLMGVG